MKELLACARQIASEAESRDELLSSLTDFLLDQLGCALGTVHLLDRKTRILHLAFERGLPEPMRAVVAQVPIGKGMAGLAAERLEPVQICNLQTDESGNARPGAKATGMQGSIAFPILASDGLVGVMGIARPDAYEFDAPQKRFLLDVGRLIAEFLPTFE